MSSRICILSIFLTVLIFTAHVHARFYPRTPVRRASRYLPQSLRRSYAAQSNYMQQQGYGGSKGSKGGLQPGQGPYPDSYMGGKDKSNIPLGPSQIDTQFAPLTNPFPAQQQTPQQTFQQNPPQSQSAFENPAPQTPQTTEQFGGEMLQQQQTPQQTFQQQSTQSFQSDTENTPLQTSDYNVGGPQQSPEQSSSDANLAQSHSSNPVQQNEDVYPTQQEQVPLQHYPQSNNYANSESQSDVNSNQFKDNSPTQSAARDTSSSDKDSKNTESKDGNPAQAALADFLKHMKSMHESMMESISSSQEVKTNFNVAQNSAEQSTYQHGEPQQVSSQTDASSDKEDESQAEQADPKQEMNVDSDSHSQADDTHAQSSPQQSSQEFENPTQATLHRFLQSMRAMRDPEFASKSSQASEQKASQFDVSQNPVQQEAHQSEVNQDASQSQEQKDKDSAEQADQSESNAHGESPLQFEQENQHSEQSTTDVVQQSSQNNPEVDSPAQVALANLLKRMQSMHESMRAHKSSQAQDEDNDDASQLAQASQAESPSQHASHQSSLDFTQSDPYRDYDSTDESGEI